MKSSFREIGQFRTDDQNHLSTQLSKLEDNIAAQFDAVEQELLPAPIVVRASTSGGTYGVGQFVVIDSTTGVISVNGQATVVGQILIANNLVHNLVFTPVTGKVNGGASVTLTNALSVLWFDGSNWWAK